MSASTPLSFNGRQFTVNLKKPAVQETPLSAKPQRLHLNEEQPTSLPVKESSLDNDLEAELEAELEADFESAWNEQTNKPAYQDAENKVRSWENSSKDHREKSKSAYQMSKPKLQAPLIYERPKIHCFNCKKVSTYQVSDAWMPVQHQPELVAPQSKTTQTHLQIIKCFNCSAGNCMACGKAPHLVACTFADSKIAWDALCSVDEAMINIREKNYTGLEILQAMRDMQPVLLQALSTLNSTITGNATPTFGFSELLRQSSLLDFIADIMRDMTVENMELNPLIIQIWEFLHTLAAQEETRNLFFEKRIMLKESSSGLRKLAFPLALLPIDQTTRIGFNSNPPKEFILWPLLQRCYKVAQQYLEANHDDVWSANVVAQRVVDVYTIAASDATEPLTASRIPFTQHQAGFATAFLGLFQAGIIRNNQPKNKVAQDEMDVDRPLKKRARGRQAAQDQGQDESIDGRGGKRTRR